MGDQDRRRSMFTLGFGALLLLWTYARIGSAYDDLWSYGVDRPSHAGLGQGAAVVGALACVATILAIAQRLPWARLAGIVAALAAIAAGIYLAWLGGSHDDKVGFDSGSLIFLGVVVIAYGAMSAWKATQLQVEE
jgi:hypothetical protein